MLHRLRLADQSMQSEVERRRMREGTSDAEQPPAAAVPGSTRVDEGSQFQRSGTQPASEQPGGMVPSPVVTSPANIAVSSTASQHPLSTRAPPALSPSRPVMLKQHSSVPTVTDPPAAPSALSALPSPQLSPSTSGMSGRLTGWQASARLAGQRQAMAAAGTAAAVSVALLAERDAMRVGIEEREREREESGIGMGERHGEAFIHSSRGRTGDAATTASVLETRSSGTSPAMSAAAEEVEDRAVSTAEVKEALKTVRSLLATKRQRDTATARKVLGRVSL